MSFKTKWKSLKDKVKSNKQKVKEHTVVTPTGEETTTHTSFYGFKPDGTLVIGTRDEIETKYKLAPNEIENSRVQKLEKAIMTIDEGFVKGIQGKVSASHEDKIVMEDGREIALNANFDAQVKATIDLSKMMIELGASVDAGIKAELKSKKLNLGGVTIQGFLNAEIVASASAKLQIEPGQVLAEAKAMAEAKLELGGTFTMPKLISSKYDLVIEPKATAYAKVEASALAAAGIKKTGVKLDASAAVGVRASVTAIIKGEASVNDDLNPREAPVVIKDAALGSFMVEVDVNLVAGGTLEFTYEFKDEQDKATNLKYKVGNMKVAGGLIVGIGVTVEGKVLEPIWEDVKAKMKQKFKDQVYKVLSDAAIQKFEDLKAKAEEIKAEIKNSATKMAVALIDLLGMHATATKIEMERHNLKIVNAIGEAMAATTAGDEALIKETFGYLKNRYKKYHTYLSEQHDYYTKKFPKIAADASKAVEGIKAELGANSPKVAKAMNKMTSKVREIQETVDLIARTEAKLVELAEFDPEFPKFASDIVVPMTEKSDFMNRFSEALEKLLDNIESSLS